MRQLFIPDNTIFKGELANDSQQYVFMQAYLPSSFNSVWSWLSYFHSSFYIAISVKCTFFKPQRSDSERTTE